MAASQGVFLWMGNWYADITSGVQRTSALGEQLLGWNALRSEQVQQIHRRCPGHGRLGQRTLCNVRRDVVTLCSQHGVFYQDFVWAS